MINQCSQCGLCCRLFLINLNEKEYQSGKYQTQFEDYGLFNDFQKAKNFGANIIKQKEDGSCFYLKKNGCSIHGMRPQVCKEFFCTSKSKRFEKMIKQIEKKRFDLVKKKSQEK